MKPLRPFFSYFGSKWRLAGKYPKPAYGVIIEPFAGSAGYSLNYHWLDVRLVDSSDVVCGVWDYLINASKTEIESLPIDGSSPPCKEAGHLIGFWLGRGLAHPKTVGSTWFDKYKNSHPGCFWGERVRSRIASQVDKIRHWKITCGDYSGLGNTRATWFVDPPYYGRAGKCYQNRFHEYEDLALWCRSRVGLVIVCEGIDGRWLNFEPLCTNNGTRRKSSEKVAVFHNVDTASDS